MQLSISEYGQPLCQKFDVNEKDFGRKISSAKIWLDRLRLCLYYMQAVFVAEI